MSDTNPDETDLAEEFESRSETIQHIIELAAKEPDLQRRGVIQEIADEADCTPSHVSHSLEKYDHLVEWYRNANLDPLDPDAVQEAYDDEDLANMAAGENEAVADGMGDLRFNVTLSAEEAFRAMKLLPGDLGMTVFRQVLSETEDMDQEGLEALFR